MGVRPVTAHPAPPAAKLLTLSAPPPLSASQAHHAATNSRPDTPVQTERAAGKRERPPAPRLQEPPAPRQRREPTPDEDDYQEERPQKRARGDPQQEILSLLVAALKEVLQEGRQGPHPPGNFSRPTEPTVTAVSSTQPRVPLRPAEEALHPPRANVPNPPHPSPGWCYAPLPWRSDPRAAEWYRQHGLPTNNHKGRRGGGRR